MRYGHGRRYYIAYLNFANTSLVAHRCSTTQAAEALNIEVGSHLKTSDKRISKMRPALRPESATLVMAHPDDEILWASSILSRVHEIILCFEDVDSQTNWSEGRRRSTDAYPLPNITTLKMPESEVFDGAAWPNPIETAYGLAVNRKPGSPPTFSESRYLKAHLQLIETIRPRLKSANTIVTHNPWGEYGHEEHVQVFRALSALQAEIGFALWVPAYVSEKSLLLMSRHLPMLRPSPQPFPTDATLCASLKDHYQANGCWTWVDNYVWPKEEYFHRWEGSQEVQEGPRHSSVFGMNIISMDWRPSVPPGYLARAKRQLRNLARRALRGRTR